MVKIGLEIHQQLATKKLFCACDSEIYDDFTGEFTRYFRATRSELGETDRAAREEELKGRIVRYQITRNTCLVEMDEEPPHEVNEEAIRIAVMVAEMLNAEVVDEIHFMRKIVIDGSNTSGFQRTAIVALDGAIESSFGEVRIPTICLEEEAARKIEERENEVVYRLDRLGIPLIEISTEPVMRSGEEVKDVAARIGYILRSTKKVRRGLGTIRQDINISLNGRRTEIKGVQNLKMIPRYVEEEIKRQRMLIEIVDILRERGVRRVEKRPEDVTEIFKKTKCKIILNAIGNGWRVVAQPLPGFAGLLKSDKYKLGKELASYVKVVGLKGLFHTDELPNYGITEEEIKKVSEQLGEDTFVLIAAPRELVDTAIDRIVTRANLAFEGVVEETRGPLPDGTSEYLRPLPGAARMYPETDIPPYRIKEEMLEEIRNSLPESPTKKIERFVREYGIASQVANQLIREGYDDIFEELVRICGNPTLVSRTLLSTLSELEDEGLMLEDLGVLYDVFTEFSRGRFAKEAIPTILKELSKGRSLKEILDEMTTATAINENYLRERIRAILEERKEFVLERGANAFSPIMGVVMQEFRGIIDGKKVSIILREELEKYLSSLKGS